jgi:hypothetical protein
MYVSLAKRTAVRDQFFDRITLKSDDEAFQYWLPLLSNCEVNFETLQVVIRDYQGLAKALRGTALPDTEEFKGRLHDREVLTVRVDVNGFLEARLRQLHTPLGLGAFQREIAWIKAEYEFARVGIEYTSDYLVLRQLTEWDLLEADADELLEMLRRPEGFRFLQLTAFQLLILKFQQDQSGSKIDEIAAALKEAANVRAGRKPRAFTNEQLEWVRENLTRIEGAVELCQGEPEDADDRPLRCLLREFIGQHADEKMRVVRRLLGEKMPPSRIVRMIVGWRWRFGRDTANRLVAEASKPSEPPTGAGLFNEIPVLRELISSELKT